MKINGGQSVIPDEERSPLYLMRREQQAILDDILIVQPKQEPNRTCRSRIDEYEEKVIDFAKLVILEIHDATSDRTVLIRWCVGEGRDGGGGNVTFMRSGQIVLPDEPFQNLVTYWLKQHLLNSALTKSMVEQPSIEAQRCRLFLEQGLDDGSIQRKRMEALIASGLDDDSLHKKDVTLIRQLIRSHRTPAGDP